MAKKIGIVILLVLLLLCGCQSKSSEEVQEGNTENTENTESTELNYEYQDVVLDRSITEGKFACYFFRSDYDYVTWYASSHAGDSTLLIAPDGTTMLIDCNTSVNAAHIVDYLQRLGITKIDYFVNSHFHSDHMGGIETILRNIEVGHVLTNDADYYAKQGFALNFMKSVEEAGIPHTVLREGDEFMLGEAKVRVYGPPADYDFTSTDDDVENNSSLVFKITYGDSSFLFCGDIFLAMEDILMEKYGEELKADVVKMNHHGYIYSESKEWVELIDAKITCGMMSSVPSDTVFFRYVLNGAVTMHTALDGTCLVYTDGDGTYDVQVEMERIYDMYGSLEADDGHLRVE